ncbi:MAG: DNA primase [Paludibacteraceae bacterium]|nr:DNA primase [Paludibacteraceae bacterium]
MIDAQTVDRIFSTADIVDVVSDYVTLKRRGVNYIGLCPFHNEKTPSFTVSPGKNICKCFGCGKGGNPVNFIMELENLSYYEALKFLAKKYNIEIEEKELTPEQIQQQNERESLMAVTEWLQKHFTNNLYNHIDGKTIGMSYFAHRGFREDIIKKFQLGYAIDKRDEYTQEAQKRGFKLEYLEKTGLTIVKENNYLIDRFHGRAIFPIHSVSGKVIGFGGRAIKKDEQVKYQNSPESDIYHKSQIVYGIYFAKNAIIRERKCYIVEGYADVISMVQAGIENIVAPCGTALTVEQIRLLRRIIPSTDEDKSDENKNVTMLYDGDSAGIHAALKNGKLLLEEGLNVKVVVLPPEDDPDTFAQKNNASDVLKYLTENETDYILFKTRHFLEESRRDPIRKAQLISDIAGTIAVIPNLIKRSVYIKECAKILETDESVLKIQMDKVRKTKIEKEYDRIKNAPGSNVSTNTVSTAPTTSPSVVPPTDEPPADFFMPDPAEGTSQQSSAPVIGTFYEEEKSIVNFIIRYGELVPWEVEYEEKNESDIEELLDSNDDNEEETETEEKTTVVKKLTVIGYISKELELDNIQFTTPIFGQILKEAKEQDEKNPNFKADRYFSQHANPEISLVAADLLPDRYQLSKMHSKSKKVEEDKDRLTEFVPHVVMDLKRKIVEKKINELKEKLKTSDPNSVMEIMQDLQKYLNVRKALGEKLGEIVITPNLRS